MKDRRGYFPAYRYPLEQNRWAEWRYEWDGDERIDAARLRLAEHERDLAELTARHALTPGRSLTEWLRAIGRFLWQLYHKWLPAEEKIGPSGRPHHGLT